MSTAVINPVNDEELPAQQAKSVLDLRKIRRGARNATRSGHPGRRAEAQKALADVPKMIEFVYKRAAGIQ